jgi:hypothetical protein
LSAELTLTQKIVEVDLILRVNEFVGGGNTKTINGLACSVNASKHGMPTFNACSIDIYNMRQEDIDKIVVDSPYQGDMKRNLVAIRAGEAGGTLSQVFSGEILNAYAIYPSADVGVHIEALTGIFPALIVAKPFTAPGAVSALTIIEQYTREMEYELEIHPEVEDKPLTDPVYNGSPMEKVKQVAKDIGVRQICDDRKIIILPRDKPLGEIVRVSPKAGIIGYPEVSNGKIRFKHIYHPGFRQGGIAEVYESVVPRANGKWNIIKIEHNLQCFGAGDAWETEITGTKHYG